MTRKLRVHGLGCLRKLRKFQHRVNRARQRLFYSHPGGEFVLACLALKSAYRDVLRADAKDICFVHLVGERDLIKDRLSSRADHFFSPALLDSQLTTLDPLGIDENFIEISVSKTLTEVVAEIEVGLAQGTHRN